MVGSYHTNNLDFLLTSVCVKEIEDSELLEVMDVFDQESSTNPTTQEHVTPVPSTAQVTHMATLKSFMSAVTS